jgi:DNA-binding transcriptional MerR regulator
MIKGWYMIVQRGNSMRMQKRKFRIGECAQYLNVEQFVIRFWEKEFGLKTDRSIGGQRFYSEEDVAQFKTIKELLYDQGFTIAGAKQHLQASQHTKVIASTKIDNELIDASDNESDTLEAKRAFAEAQHCFEQQKKQFVEQLVMLQQQLVKLQQILSSS